MFPSRLYSRRMKKALPICLVHVCPVFVSSLISLHRSYHGNTLCLIHQHLILESSSLIVEGTQCSMTSILADAVPHIYNSGLELSKLSTGRLTTNPNGNRSHMATCFQCTGVPTKCTIFKSSMQQWYWAEPSSGTVQFVQAVVMCLKWFWVHGWF